MVGIVKGLAGWFSRRDNRFGLLTLSIIVWILSAPVIPYLPLAQVIFAVMGAVIPLAAIVAISENRRHARIGLILGLPAVFGAVWNVIEAELAFEWVTLLFPPIFYLFTVWVVGSRVFKARDVKADTLWGAACVYLLIGVTWWFFYLALEDLMPGSFAGGAAASGAIEDKFDLLYFSFVTLTTLGYGDMLPLTRPVQTLAILEAATGVLYMGIVIAKLVGAYASQAVHGGAAPDEDDGDEDEFWTDS